MVVHGGSVLCVFISTSPFVCLSLLSLYVHVHVVMRAVHGCMLWYGFGAWVYAVA